ncbi:polysaccharide biosynthesis C-terminal domain-containing protein [Arthrobacter sp. D1-17]
MTLSAQRVALSGAHGFLGFHTRAALQRRGYSADIVPVGTAFDEAAALRAIDGADRLIHLAGVNRGEDVDIAEGNLRFAKQLSRVLAACKNPPPLIVYANSIQAGNGSVYGQAKQAAADALERAALDAGVEFLDVLLPNLFGEHGRPFYNSVTATFCHLLARGESPQIRQDSRLTLLHAQDAAEFMIGVKPIVQMEECVSVLSVSDLLRQLTDISQTYRSSYIPPLASAFDRDLFNTYRSFLPPSERRMQLSKHADARGAFFEVVKSEGSGSQTSFSTTVPGVIRGQHFHTRKVERFTVLAGKARISMRRLFNDEVLSFDVDGSNPVAIDMPTLWAHNIENVGSDLLYTSFWTNEIFDPAAPDTFPENV